MIAERISNYDPRATEALLMQIVERAARDKALMPSNEELADRLGLDGLSTAPGILNRLEARGLIKVDRYQRSRRVTIISTGESTAMPSNTAPHWRNRPSNVPTPALSVIRSRDPETSALLMRAARNEGRDLAAFLADMVWLGFQQYEASIQAGRDKAQG